MSDRESNGSAIKIEVSDAYMRWLTTHVFLPVLITTSLGWIGVNSIGIDNMIAFLQNISESHSSETGQP